MTFLKTTLAISAMGLLLGIAGHAEKATPLSAIVCAGNDGSKLNQNVYAYTVETDGTAVDYFTVYLGGSHFNSMLSAEYFGAGYSTCSLTILPNFTLENVKIQSVTSSGVGIDVDGGALSEDGITQEYTIVTFSYTDLGWSGGVAKPGARTPTLSPEEAKALEAFRARGLGLPKH